MRGRWFTVVFTLVPVLFVPACFSADEVIEAMAKKPVRGAATTIFPILAIGKHGVDIVPLASNIWKSAGLRAADPAAIERAVSKLRVSTVGPENTNAAAYISDGAGVQNVHLVASREVAMGSVRSESWYATDGKQVFPRFERELPLMWPVLEGVAWAVPMSLILAGCAAFVILHCAPVRLPPRNAVRVLVLALGLVYASSMTYDHVADATTKFGVPAMWLVFWAAAAWVQWFSGWRIRTRLPVIVVLVFVAAGVYVVRVPDDRSIYLLLAAVIGFTVFVALNVASFIARCLAAAITAAALARRVT